MHSPIRAILFDLAGTTVDHGCLAPVEVFLEVFRRHGVSVTHAQARAPMGTHKREHLAQMLAMPEILAQWQERHGPIGEAGVDRLYEQTVALQLECLPRHSRPIRGVNALMADLEQRGIAWGVTTGYSRLMMDVTLASARPHGFIPPVAVSASEVPEGRPAPFLCWTALMRLGAWPASACVNVGDTIPDVESGRNAGMWSVAVVETGNGVGMSEAELDALPAARRVAIRKSAGAQFMAAGAHYIVDSAAELGPVLEEIEERIRMGEKPSR